MVREDLYYPGVSSFVPPAGYAEEQVVLLFLYALIFENTYLVAGTPLPVVPNWERTQSTLASRGVS